MELNRLDTILAARDALAAREVSALELTQHILAKIDRLNPRLRAFNSVSAERALLQARAVDAGERTGPLAGIPIAIKDNLCTSWGTTTCSSRMLEHFRAPYDATVVSKLEAAGAVIVGKTNLDEFAMGSSTENSAWGATRNPWDQSKVPGGSSGGAAAALAAGLCLGSIGSDTGGSIRQPAALCGLVGLKPTYGRVSRYGLVAFASSLDQIGPLAWSAQDAALLMGVMAGHDGMDATSMSDPIPDYLSESARPIPGLRIGIARQLMPEAGVDSRVWEAVQGAINIFKKLGAILVEIDLPSTDFGIAAYYVIAPCEASSNLARYDGVHFGHRTKEAVRDIVELSSKSRAEGFGPEVQRRIMIGAYALSAGYADQYYVQALKMRRVIRQEFDRAFEQCDLIVSPTSPTPAFDIGEKTGDPLAMYLCDVFTVTCNIAGISGISVPCGFTADPRPLPIGMQFLGPAQGEAMLLRAASMYQRETNWHLLRPALE